jgi:hypothetical protein
MPDITEWADTFRDWDGLIGALNENGALIPGHEAQKADLTATYEQARLLRVQQESLKGNAIAATDRFLDAVDEGKDKARKLRSFIVSVLGPRNPKLKLFGIPPKAVPNPNNRPSRRRRTKKPAAPPQAPGNPPAPQTPTDDPPVVVKAAE